MDVAYSYNRLAFCWDEAKDRSDKEKHSFSFKLAAEVFLDPLACFEDASSGEESRQSILGITAANQLALVVHLEYRGGVIRIISAREATLQERRRYEDNA